ncbi:hypothetical protein Enr13x_34620 [Stieleria neptunia]|uniref:Uncharacterized protein n=1 Tax=Stieleria neptunia TaxID=2527979 RepID=A0A518HRX6_9BACT|nr:hypothetical protein Enr13x_34620 [Stieleria neptunia]
MIGKHKPKAAERVGRWSQALYPLLLIVVLVYSFV